MISLFMDVCRKRPEGFSLTRSKVGCLLLCLDATRFLEIAARGGRR
ncbi:hypothetical protein [Paenibacillus graminis]|nr:hypothetical protein [Paenibacillus graminis]MEC0169459.1 hypothetical protein [Paenibacillus graminis]